MLQDSTVSSVSGRHPWDRCSNPWKMNPGTEFIKLSTDTDGLPHPHTRCYKIFCCLFSSFSIKPFSDTREGTWRAEKKKKNHLTNCIINLGTLMFGVSKELRVDLKAIFPKDNSVHISCAGAKAGCAYRRNSEYRGRTCGRMEKNTRQVLKVNRSSVKQTERGHELTLFCDGSAGVSGTRPLQPSVRRQDSCSTSVFLKSSPGSMTLIKPHLNERLSCFNEDIPAN